MNNDEGLIVWVAVIVAVVWLSVGGGWTTVKGWLGQDTYEDRRAALAQVLKAKPIGTSQDYWLVKGNWSEPDRVALFFGYLDDFSTCFEFATMYMARYPLDTYSCQPANQ